MIRDKAVFSEEKRRMISKQHLFCYPSLPHNFPVFLFLICYSIKSTVCLVAQLRLRNASATPQNCRCSTKNPQISHQREEVENFPEVTCPPNHPRKREHLFHLVGTHYLYFLLFFCFVSFCFGSCFVLFCFVLFHFVLFCFV